MNSILVKIGPQYKIFKRIYQDLMRGCFMGGTLQGLPEDEDERSKACVQLAIIALLSDGKTSLEFNVDEMAEAIDVMMVNVTCEKLESLGLIRINHEKKDEYGFPVVAEVLMP
ncbi:MAG: hypothetical protein IJG87_02150 [Ruminococcus sp.]|nr:hypothetical protein [Ruminococcus sp.]